MGQNIVKQSKAVRELLMKRWEDLEISMAKVVKDAIENNRPSITKSKMSIYINLGKTKGSPTEEDIIWLCMRYCIDIKLTAKAMKYNKEEALKKLREYF